MRRSKSNQKEIKHLSAPQKRLGKRLKQWWQNWQWSVMLLGVVIVFVLGYFGFSELKKGFSALDKLYRILQLFVLSFDTTIIDVNLKLEIARWLAPAIAAYTAVRALALIFSEQLQLFKIRFLRSHIIICGLGNKGLLLSQKFIDYGKECRDIGALVLVGNAVTSHILRRAGLRKAKYLFPVCGQDSINAEVAVQARKLITGKRGKPLTCVVHIIDPQLCRLIKEREFELEKNDAFRLEFFNLFDYAARTIIDLFPPFNVQEKLQSPVPHLLIIGVGRLGESLMVKIVKRWMELPDKPHEKLKISVIDKAAKKRQKLFYLRYPRLVERCELIPLEMDINSPEFEGGSFLFNSSGECGMTIIYICLDNDSFALSTALTLHQRLRKYNVPIVVRMNSEAGLTDLIQNGTHGLGRLQGFGLLDKVLNPELLLMGTHEILARVIHDEYRGQQLEKGETLESNPSLVPWDELPEGLKESNRRQADSLGVKLGKIGCYIVPMTDWNADPIEFTPGEIEMMAEMEHEDWMDERLTDGWEYAPGPKDINKKKSPSLIPWNKLSEEEKEKDRNPVRQMPTFLEKAGFQIYRREK
jgi:hypothetical protein